MSNVDVELSSLVASVAKSLSGKRFSLSDEKETQSQIAKILLPLGATREYRLSKKHTIDFFFSVGVGIEVKIKGSAMQIYRQCKAYCSYDDIKALILVSNKAMGFPSYIDGVPCYFVSMGRSWL